MTGTELKTAAPAGAEAEAPRADPVNVLLVDDQPANLLALEAVLQDLGENLVRAASGREALRWLLSNDCAVILLDVKMPDLDGFQTAELVRQRERSSATPIIFLTADSRSTELAWRGYELGAVDYLIKPIIPEFVRSKVRVFVELARKNELLGRQARQLQEKERRATQLAETRAALVEELRRKNRELESFSYAVSHDLRAPLRRIRNFSRALLETSAGHLGGEGGHYLDRICESIDQMESLIVSVMRLSEFSQASPRRLEVDLSALSASIVSRLEELEPGRQVQVVIRPGMSVLADPQLLQLVMENLLGNAWKFTARREGARIQVGSIVRDGEPVFFVRDNGAGFDMNYADRLFGPFQRLHRSEDYPGSGIGLATVQRIIYRHGGRVWAEGLPEQGATFYFTIGKGLEL